MMKESDGMDLIKKRIAASAFALVTALSVCITAAPVSSVQAQVQDVQSQENDVSAKDTNTINFQTDFEYELQGDSIVLRRYIGDAKEVNIPATATIDGVTYNVRLNDDCSSFFAYKGDIEAWM